MPLQSVKLQDCWDDILPKIEEIMHDLPWKDFRKEDIYTSCANGNAAIFVDSDAPLGESFFIARIDEYESTKERVLFLWIAYSSEGEAALSFSETIFEIARNAGCNSVEFATGSEAVMKHGENFGFNGVIYRCRKAL